MSTVRTVLKSLLTSALLGGALLAGGAHADTITLRADEWCPYNCTPGADKPGYMIEVAKRVFEKAGHTIDYQVLNWARAIEETRQGKHTAIVGAAKNDAEDFVFPVNELGQSINAYATRADDGWSFTDIPSLTGRTLGVVRDYSYGDNLDAYIKEHAGDEGKIQVVSGDNALEINFRKLEKKRVDTVVDGSAVLRYNIARLGLGDKVRIAGQNGEPDPVYIAFSPADPKGKEYAELLSKGIDELRASGELKKILEGYGLSDWK